MITSLTASRKPDPHSAKNSDPLLRGSMLKVSGSARGLTQFIYREFNGLQEIPTPSSNSVSHRTRVLIADPYPMIVHGLRVMVEDDSRFKVVASASTLPSFLNKVIVERPEVAWVDWRMASQDLSGTAELLNSHSHRTAIIFFLTVSENRE